MADESVPFWWVLVFLLLALGVTFVALQFIGAEIVGTLTPVG